MTPTPHLAASIPAAGTAPVFVCSATSRAPEVPTGPWFAAGEAVQGVAERSAIPEEYKWDLTQMYPSDLDWSRHYGQVEALVAELSGLRGTAGRSPEGLAWLLELRDTVDVQLEKLYAYAYMLNDQDMRVPASQELKKRAQTLSTRYAESTAWLAPELIGIPRQTVASWLQRSDLIIYAHYFDNLFRLQEHVLSPREEELLAMSGKATSSAGETYGLLTNAELRLPRITDRHGREIEVSHANFYSLLYSPDRRERRDAYLGFMSSFLEIKNSLASTLAGSVERDWFYAKARRYGSCLEASLNEENLPVSVYHSLISTVNDNLHLLQRFTALKKRALRLDDIRAYDLYVDIVEVPERKYTYEEGRDLILDGIAPLGPEYLAMMKTAFASRWIDVYENRGKRSGAYNMGTYLAPPYVLLNFSGTYNDVSTIAHELGHAMQSHFAARSQPPVYSGYPMFTAEVASTAAEIVFKEYVLRRTTDRTERAWMIHSMLENIRTTVFRQARFSEFDLAIHELAQRGEPLTAEAMMKLGRGLFGKYYGPELVLDGETDVECLRIPHYYRNFYVYRYATSYSAATALAQRILDEEPGAAADFMKFLRIGNSMYALDMLKVAGVDMSTPRPVEECMAVFGRLLGELEELAGAPAGR